MRLITLFLLALLPVACGRDGSSPVTNSTPKQNQEKGADHAHKPGAHGGQIISIAGDNYHAEAIFASGGVVRIFMLGQDEAKVQEVDVQDLHAFAKQEGAMESKEMTFKPEPQKGDAPGKTSLFVGKLPAEFVNKKVEITIPNITIGKDRYRFGSFSSSAERSPHAMPADLGSSEEQELFLKPGGIYTAADIKANGNTTPTKKYSAFRAAHDMKPKAGEQICPVTETKANVQCTWIVAGKTYEFCCPPCIQEFVRWAKEEPAKIKEPKDYVKAK